MGKRQRSTGDNLQGPLKVSGPESIQTLRGHLLGRQVALICCSESHEDAIDLTRSRSIPTADNGWVEAPYSKGRGNCNRGLDLKKALKSKHGITRKSAWKWAKSEAKGSAYVLPSKVGRSSEHPVTPDQTIYVWADLDEHARNFNQRRQSGERVPPEEHLALIADRKQRRLNQGFELLDDWLIRHAKSEKVHVEVLLEAPVPAAEVELHKEPSVGPAPPAHECLRRLELDSEEESDDDDEAGDASGSFLEYLYLRLRACIPANRLHCIDPRELGCDNDKQNLIAFQSLLKEPLPADADEFELKRLDAKHAVELAVANTSPLLKPAVMRRQAGKWRRGRERHAQFVPSWEAFFGVAAEILYHSLHVKADYAPFLAKCVGSPDALSSFFEKLYFGTVPDALSVLRLDEETRRFARLRSSAYRPRHDAPLMRRPDDQGLVPAKVAPVDFYLKARGSNPPRTWVSGLVTQLQSSGGGDIARAAKSWYSDSVNHLLKDPKGDDSGDYFIAWLRASHRKIYDDIDKSDPEELVKKQWADSEKHPGSKKHRHNLKDIRIPSFKEAFAELVKMDLEAGTSTSRQQMLGKMLVDCFQLRLVDLGAVLKMGIVAGRAAENESVVIVLYAGADHVKNIANFWRSQGFVSCDLPNGGLVGKDSWEDDESRMLELPSYLHNLEELFPVADKAPKKPCASETPAKKPRLTTTEDISDEQPTAVKLHRRRLPMWALSSQRRLRVLMRRKWQSMLPKV
eukprot:TRINITY_DN27349_c0_g1_i2.p1 TRINITY_DN27349_c0_g1~~TRINITY_DN27349_c0_g1_i2.p1  ORF type:complete len:742 (-),score=131.78 TRINITY_DN27349_c0_g1_i2:242-2467(-)